MKKSIISTIVTLLIPIVIHAAELPNAVIYGTTNKEPLSYQVGEEMIFKFQLKNVDNNNSSNTFFKYFRRGDDGKTFEGKAPSNEPLILKTSLDRAGFVGIDVFLVDSEGKNVTSNGKKIAFYAGSAVNPESLTDCGEPEDFDKFWEEQLKKLAAVPFRDKVEKVLLFTKGTMSYYKVKVPCLGPRPMTAYLCMPSKAAKQSLKVEVHFCGYGTYKVTCPTQWPKHDRITLLVNAHGMELGESDEYYKEFFASLKSNGYNYAFDPELNKKLETCYFYGMAMRALRAVEYAKTLPEWDGKNLIAIGGSQAGLQTMWVTALDIDVSESYPSIIWCCDMAGTTKKQRCHGGWRVKHTPILDYFDPVFMAKRIKNAQVHITRAGLGDYICPPSGLAICYRNLATPHKKIVWVQGSSHDFTPADAEKVIWANE